MSRKGIVNRRVPATDPVFSSDIVEKFICSMMYEGKKSTAQRVFYGAMDQVAKKTNDEAIKIFKKAIENVKPLLEVKTRRVGGAKSAHFAGNRWRFAGSCSIRASAQVAP
jgi:small subunit ribosomal protein S7